MLPGLNLSGVLPEDDIPRQVLGLPPMLRGHASRLSWYGSDSEERYRSKISPDDPVYGRNAPELTYDLNSYGYRCPEFTAQGDIRMAVFGCSFSFGVGVRREELYHEIFAAHLEHRYGRQVVNWNLSVSGASNDHIARLIPFALRRLDPHLVIVCFAPKARRECVDDDGSAYNVNPREGSSSSRRTKYSAVVGLSSAHQDILNFYGAFTAIRHQLAGRRAVYCLLHDEALRLPGWLRDSVNAAAMMRLADRGRDGAHPGPRSHKTLADSLIERFDWMPDTSR